nr:odorant receptor 131-2-like [Labrus bergylta]
MDSNNSLVSTVSVMQSEHFKFIFVQVLVAVFLCINFMLITTFFTKEFFYTTMRYILFAVTLLSDCVILIVTNLLIICNYLKITMNLWLCAIMFILSTVYSSVTPFTLTAMTLERYVAICMPLRHGDLCSTRCSLHCILLIHGLSSIHFIVDLSIYFASTSIKFYKQSMICNVWIFILYRWQDHLRNAIKTLYFLFMCITIVFSYVRIMKAARAASGEDRKSTWKGLKTVILHAFQLLLCLIQLWCPLIESAVLQTNVKAYINLRYVNYIIFYVASRCLSPLIYGLRDEKFFCAMKSYLLCGFYKKKNVI